ncbi:MAG TPA: zinc-ribbon and DUF3426 domain-containing protein [Casimicrobiaceae bacterium]|nr:zinc-ribbon and DUF3426 domain-containing protein [Casimicrobiaceae bacterium]
MDADPDPAVKGTERMPDQKFTRCPGCSTVFRVSEAQLALREGQVRCGHCRAVFDANDHRVSLDAAPPPDDFDATDELMLGRPTVTLRSADALQPAHFGDDAATPRALAGEETREAMRGDRGGWPDVHEATRGDREGSLDIHDATREDTARAPETPEATRDDEASNADIARSDEAIAAGADNVAARVDAPTAEEVPSHLAGAERRASEDATRDTKGTIAAPPYAVGDGAETTATDLAEGTAPALPVVVAPGLPGRRFEWRMRTSQNTPPRRLYALAASALVIGLALQAILEYRDAVAARLPATRPMLETACGLLGCTIEPLRDAAALSIDASDLQADPAHRGLLLLSATVRNRAGHAVAFPDLELTLTDSSDRVVARRAFPPEDYAGGTADPHQGIPPNGERIIRMFLDASATQQAGYRLYLFYP